MENAERDRRVVALQRKQTDALDRLAEVAQRREERATAPLAPDGAQIGARLIHLGGADHRVTIRNAGPGPANIIDVLTLDHRAQVLEPTGLGTLRLMPGRNTRSRC